MACMIRILHVTSGCLCSHGKTLSLLMWRLLKGPGYYYTVDAPIADCTMLRQTVMLCLHQTQLPGIVI